MTEYRFAILFHKMPPGQRPSHWDLLLEDQGEGLATWALEKPPAGGVCCDALELPRHRRLYLDYSGAIVGKGAVQRWDHGTWRPLELDGPGRRIELRGQAATIELILTPCPENPQQWRIRCSVMNETRGGGPECDADTEPL